MDEQKEIIKDQLDQIPSELKQFLLTNKWVADLSLISSGLSINNDQKIQLENEVFLVLIGLEPKADFVSNIVKELKLSQDVAQKISDEVNRLIFSIVDKHLNNYWVEVNKNSPHPDVKNYDSFEKAILHQAQAMREAGSGLGNPTGVKAEVVPKPAISNPNLTIADIQKSASTVPTNLPGAINTNQKPISTKIDTKIDSQNIGKSYTSGSDPYRESIE